MKFRLIINLIIITLLISNRSLANAANSKEDKSSIFHGYITNKNFKPLKLKIFEIDKNSFFLLDRNLENNSFIPYPNLKVTSEITSDYFLEADNINIFIPESTKLVGYISEIKEPRIFNKKGFYKITFNKAICPNGQKIFLHNEITSNSINSSYNLLHHVGKTTLGLLGGSLAGALVSYGTGGIPLILATHGYSVALGAATGGFIGLTTSFTTKGEQAYIEPGDQLYIAPIDETSLNKLKQINCTSNTSKPLVLDSSEKVKIQILNIKQKKDIFGETALKVKILFTNNSKEHFRLSNFFLRDSQGKEYSTSFIDLKDDVMIEFLPYETKKAELEFFIDYPNTSHWLVLKDKDFNEEIGNWKLKG